MRTIGLMSGTSLDGVDAAWIETDGERIGRIGPALTLPYDAALRDDLRRLLDLAPSLPPADPFLAGCVRRLTERHAEAVAAIGEAADLVGFHGQTILHRPGEGLTWQVGDAALLAARCGLPVAHDFRSADVAAGGQGAPLAPALHAALARDLPKPVAVLNLGGVGNVTWIGEGGAGEHEALVAFDTGPANGPLDDWAKRHTGEDCDRDGALALAGTPDAAVLGRLLAHPYLAAPPPKSLDRLDFGRALAAAGLEALSPADGAATLVAFSAGAVAAAARHLPSPPRRWLVCGGGRRNPAMLRALGAALAAPVEPVEAVGWDGDALEAQAFGLLAARVARGLPLSFPGTTGVPSPWPGGRIARPEPVPAG
ncbi:anhydro-N-acetylmuramic acid kinase [Roseomonas sp. NAR14]|uniref:Anhydro-N-acetylmuramic acid kinase n=1 Tax=Roseomonas acroporae TaxID=2937791 RepID=A0A9X2BTB6_9PROT|nr:anhydro-N-acetylmuramic acid kinase [Roseomonas acroporae]MCK8784107.1 anhydro-N-acetylmuramic acid kinase [Roseomonas acroporae]